MQSAKELTDRAASRLATPSATSGSPISESVNSAPPATLSADSIETLFKTFARRWSHRWEKTFTDSKARALWMHDLRALAVTDQLLTKGLHKSATLSWPPSPAEFAALCHPTEAELGLPDIDTAYRNASVSRWSHPVVYEAARRVGTFEIRNWSESKGRPLFERAFKTVCAEWMAGARFEAPRRQALEHKPVPAGRETALEHLRRMRELVGR